MFIWMAKFGAYGVRTGIHVGVDLLSTGASALAQKGHPVRLAVRAFFTGMIASFGGSFVGEMFKTGQQSSDLEARCGSSICDPARFRPDVLPLSAGCVVLLLDRRPAAPVEAKGRGHRSNCAGAAVDGPIRQDSVAR